MVLEEGVEAPRVKAPDQDNELVTVDYEAPAVIYFYPEDGTPGCTTEAEQFQWEHETYREANVKVYGVSTDPVESHADFSDELNLSFPLLSDPDGRIAEQFGVKLENDRFERTTIVVVDGRIHRTYEGVKPDGHARNILLDLLDDGVVELE